MKQRTRNYEQFSLQLLLKGKSKEQRLARKTIVWLGLLMTMVLWQAPNVLLGYTVFFAIWMWWRGISLPIALNRLIFLLPFGAGTLLLLPITIPGDIVWQWGWFAVSAQGLQQALVLTLKMINASFILTILLHAVNTADWLRSLKWLRVPGVLVDLLQVMMRYLHLLSEEARAMIQAQRARGFRSGGWLWTLANYKRFGEMLGVLFVRSMRRSERVYQAMLSRGANEGVAVSVNAPFAMEMKGIAFRYPGTERDVLRGIDVAIPSGSKTVLMGMNGAGKSTLISLMNGLAHAQVGSYSLFGVEMNAEQAKSARQTVGVVYQDPDDQLFSPTVAEDVAYGPRNLGLDEHQIEDRVSYALGAVGLRELADRSPFELSYGQKRRVAIAGVMAMRTPVMVLDEPMAYLDPRGRDELQALLEQLHFMGTTLLIATHDVDFAAEWADHVVLLKDGKVLAQGSTDLLFDDRLLQEAGLHLPRLARPFRLLQGLENEVKPRTVRDAAQWIWKLMRKERENAVVKEQQETKDRNMYIL